MGRTIRTCVALLVLSLVAGVCGGSALRGGERRRRRERRVERRPIIVSTGSARLPDGDVKAKGAILHQFTTKPPFHQSAYHAAPISNLDTEELKRRTETLIAARQREIQGEMNATMQQMRSQSEADDDAAFKERAFEAAETVQQLQTRHLPGMEDAGRRPGAKNAFDPRKDPLWNIVMRKKRTGSAYKTKQRAKP